MLEQLRERLKRSRGERTAELRAEVKPPPCPEERLGIGCRAGDRVVDLVTGLEGEIVGATAEIVTIPASNGRPRRRRDDSAE